MIPVYRAPYAVMKLRFFRNHKHTQQLLPIYQLITCLCPPVSLSTPTVSGHDTSMWTLTSPYGIQVERYIVEFECRVRHITFVEKSMSVSARGGTGQVATNASCLGGLSHLYKVKVWAVSGPNISPALICTPVKQCSEEGGSYSRTCTTNWCGVVSMYNI